MVGYDFPPEKEAEGENPRTQHCWREFVAVGKLRQFRECTSKRLVTVILPPLEACPSPERDRTVEKEPRERSRDNCPVAGKARAH